MTEPQPGAGEKTDRKRRGAAWLLLPVVLGGLVWAYAPRRAAPKVWRAEAELEFLRPAPTAPADPLIGAGWQEDDSMETQAALMQTSEMARLTLIEMKDEALARGRSVGDVPFTEAQVAQALHVTNPPGTRLLTITAEAGDPEQAQQLAEATARAVVRWKQDNAQIEQHNIEDTLRRRYARARKVADKAAGQEAAFSKAAPVDPPGAADARRQNAQIATDLARRLQTALDFTRLQSDHVSGGVIIVEHGHVPEEPGAERRF